MRRRTGVIGLVVAALVIIAGVLPAVAVEPHEDPDAAPWVFDGVAVLQKYSQALDAILKKDSAGVKQLLEEADAANIPPELRNTVHSFLSSGLSLSGLIPVVETDLENAKILLAQYRAADARQSLLSVREKLRQAYSSLLVMESTALGTGRWWKVDSTRPESALHLAYDDAQAKLLRLRQLLDLLDDMHRGLTGQIEFSSLRQSTLSLTVEPETAFVGDKVKFRGVLSSDGKPLSGRIVTILLDHAPVSSKLSDEMGIFQSEIVLPYRYVSNLTLQALYYPVGNDIGQYLGSSSPAVTINVLYYETGLSVAQVTSAYPGRDFLLKASFNYGNPSQREGQVADERSLSVYWDGELAAELTESADFSLRLPVAANTSPGIHRLTVYVAPRGRYAPAKSMLEVEVIKLAPVIEVSTPDLVLLPFTHDIHGKVYSFLGPLQNAGLEITLGKWRASPRTLADGTFHARLDTGMSLTLLGSQDLRVTVAPAEPWHRTGSVTVRLLVLNPANIAGILLILVIPALFGISRLRRRVTRAESVPAPEPVPALVKRGSLSRPAILAPTAKGDPRTVLLSLYQGILRFVQEITAVVLLPYQTLREFAHETTPKLGVLGPSLVKDFQDFTLMIERLLYSRHPSTEADATHARELSDKLLKGSRE